MNYTVATEDDIRGRKTGRVIEPGVLYPSDIAAEMMGIFKNIPVRMSQNIADGSVIGYRIKNSRKNYFLGKDIINYNLPKIINSKR